MNMKSLERGSPEPAGANPLLGCVALLAGLAFAGPVAAEGTGTRVDIYGHAMLDMGYQANQNDPDWFDVVRPTKLPSFQKRVRR